VFEGFGPVGERRSEDFGGRVVETQAVFPGDVEGDGVDGLRQYLSEHREEEFLENLCRKLLSYALGRTLIPADDELLHQMRTNLKSRNYAFSSLIETIVTSPPFMSRR
jgi:hypothetical protein